MALRDQPYLPLYIQDFLTDEKLMDCSAESTGVYIRLMCLMHKSELYGKILLKQKYKQSDNQIKNFASQIARHFPYFLPVVENSLAELVAEKVLHIEGEYLIQPRMVKDNELSETRSKAGRSGGKKTALKNKTSDKNFASANSQANTEYENEYESEVENEIKKEKGAVSNSQKTHEQKFIIQLKNWLEGSTGYMFAENDYQSSSELFYFLKRQRFEKTKVNEKLTDQKALDIIQGLYNGLDEFEQKNFGPSYVQRHWGKLCRKVANPSAKDKNKSDWEKRMKSYAHES